MFGAAGGLLPIVLNVLVVDLALTFQEATTPAVLGFVVRVLVLLVIGALVGYAHRDERSAWKLVQLGVAAPALLTALVNGDQRTKKVALEWLTAPAYASQAGITLAQSSSADSDWGEFLRGLLGGAPDSSVRPLSDDGTDRGATKKQYNDLLAACPSVTKVPDVINPQGHVRADLGLICYAPNGESGFVFFRASAMNRATYRTNHAPWLHLSLVRKNGSTGRAVNFVLAEVVPCGGYTNHVQKLPDNFRQSDIQQVRFSLSNSSASGCAGRGGGVIADPGALESLIRWVKDAG